MEEEEEGRKKEQKFGLFQIKSENCRDSGVVTDAVLFLQCSQKEF